MGDVEGSRGLLTQFPGSVLTQAQVCPTRPGEFEFCTGLALDCPLLWLIDGQQVIMSPTRRAPVIMCTRGNGEFDNTRNRRPSPPRVLDRNGLFLMSARLTYFNYVWLN